ncbi:hypothetical protein BT96DRAFT_931813 [Gymnopus androsaceus JB14]|uniref:Uncharacterized protein n=1 Tax=Gymnopus androsaceus JB14 TaxID=1447944 RepID=A0A6A4IMK2_9AGAR|nr:hypothetical protein BT96DRAFT_931813 [Gymnopus androsaceus JB14]
MLWEKQAVSTLCLRCTALVMCEQGSGSIVLKKLKPKLNYGYLRAVPEIIVHTSTSESKYVLGKLTTTSASPDLPDPTGSNLQARRQEENIWKLDFSADPQYLSSILFGQLLFWTSFGILRFSSMRTMVFATLLTAVTTALAASTISKRQGPSFYLLVCTEPDLADGSCGIFGAVFGTCTVFPAPFYHNISSLANTDFTGVTCTVYVNDECTGDALVLENGEEVLDLATSNPYLKNPFGSYECISGTV